MQIPAPLDLEHFSDSPYANELRRDFPDLRFAAALEKDFQAFHLDQRFAQRFGRMLELVHHH